ncbi:MAG: hypothetical protein ABI647_17265 [Gemmatimonadota bacterium]
MPENSRSAKQPAPDADRALTDRVRDRVQRATQALERRDSAKRPKVRRGARPRTAAAASAETPAGPPKTIEHRALRAVFHDLGEAHREYRRKTGEPVSPALLAAARAFKQQPSLGALVPVAGFLDALDLLAW